MTEYHSILEQLNPTERRLIRGMYDKFWLDVESDALPLSGCGWCDFDGVSGTEPYDPERWLTMGLVTKRTQEGRHVYCLTLLGGNIAQGLPSPYDDVMVYDPPTDDIDDVAF